MSQSSEWGRPKGASSALALAILGIGLFLLSACSDSSSPTSPDESVLVFEGEVAYQSSQSFDLRIKDSRIVRIEVLQIRAVLIESNYLATGATLSVGLGTPVGEDCLTTYSFPISSEGDYRVFSLQEGDHCVLVYDGGALPEDALVEFTLMADTDHS